MNRWSLQLALIAGISVFSVSVYADEIKTNSAVMQAMDKVTGRVNKITVPVNSKIAFGDFSLVLRTCKKRPAEETPENFAFVDVTDKSFGSDEYNIFRGWLLSSAPGINAIEHPIYDVWLLECIDSNVDTAKLMTQEELDARDNLPSKESIATTSEKNTEVVQNPEVKEIHINEFIQQDRDIEKDIRETPTYIVDSSDNYVSDIDEGAEPENLLLFTKEVETTSKENDEKIPNNDKEKIDKDDFSSALDEEINKLREN